MEYNAFDTTTGRQLIALDLESGEFTYTSPAEVDRNPERYTPYDFRLERRPPVEENGTKYERWARIPTVPTKQKEDAAGG